MLFRSAGLWACACLGLAIGIGFIEGATITLVLIILTLKFMSKVDSYLIHYGKTIDLYMEFENHSNLTTFLEEMHRRGIMITNLEVSRKEEDCFNSRIAASTVPSVHVIFFLATYINLRNCKNNTVFPTSAFLNNIIVLFCNRIYAYP